MFRSNRSATIKQGIWLLAGLLLLPVRAEPKVHAVDQSLESCLAEATNASTSGIRACIDRAYSQWDREMNRVYQALIKKLNPQSRKLLQESQRSWIKQRDLEFKFVNSVYNRFDGTLYIPMRANESAEFVKQRTLQLQHYLDLLTEHEPN